MNNLTEALQRLAEADERFYFRTNPRNTQEFQVGLVNKMAHLGFDIIVESDANGNLTQDSCDEIAAAIGYVIHPEVRYGDEGDSGVYVAPTFTNLDYFDELDPIRLEAEATGALVGLPPILMQCKQASLTAAINHYLESNVHNG